MAALKLLAKICNETPESSQHKINLLSVADLQAFELTMRDAICRAILLLSKLKRQVIDCFYRYC